MMNKMYMRHANALNEIISKTFYFLLNTFWCFGALVLWCVLWDLKNGIIQKNNRNIEKIYLNVIHKRTE